MEPSGKELYPWICTCQSERPDYARLCRCTCSCQRQHMIVAIPFTWTARLISLTVKQESLSEPNDNPERPAWLLYSRKTWEGVEVACMCVQFCCSLAGWCWLTQPFSLILQLYKWSICYTQGLYPKGEQSVLPPAPSILWDAEWEPGRIMTAMAGGCWCLKLIQRLFADSFPPQCVPGGCRWLCHTLTFAEELPQPSGLESCVVEGTEVDPCP